MDKCLKSVKDISQFNILELDREGIYFFYDNEDLIYIGESNNILRRIFCNHRNGSKNNSTLIRRILRGDLGKNFSNVEEVKKYIKKLNIKILIEDELINKDFRKKLEKEFKKLLKPKL